MKKIMILSALIMLWGCASDIGTGSYTTESIGGVSKAAIGTIINVRTVKVADEGNGGSIIGGVAGAAAGTLAGSNDATQIIGGALGAAAGSWAGSKTQQMASAQTGYEYVVQLQSGGVVTVTQGADIVLGVGQKCIVLYGQRARVIPFGGAAY